MKMFITFVAIFVFFCEINKNFEDCEILLMRILLLVGYYLLKVCVTITFFLFDSNTFNFCNTPHLFCFPSYV